MAFAAVNSSANRKAFSVVDTSVGDQSLPAVDYSVIDKAFAADASLRKRVYDAISASPQHGPLFQDIARYTYSLSARTQTAVSQPVQPVEEEHAIKKRKLQNGDALRSSAAVSDLTADAPLQFYVQDVSFAVPQRKKLALEMTAAGGYLRARNQTSKEIEFGLAMGKIQHVLCLPVPEKSQRQFNFCVIPKYGDGITPPPDGEAIPESMVWTVADGPPKAAYSGSGQQFGDEETAEALIRRMLNETLGHTKVIRPDEREFVSAMPEAHRKGEKAYHVKAFRGSKEGYLFFLSTGIFFGFKKPLLFFAFENIESISYTSVLQRTFNLNIATRIDSSQGTQEYEFAMIDQADHAGIDAYVKRHGLQDASLAEARRAKKYNVNAAKGGEETGDGEMGQESELQKAERELQDQEDEEEEDYDPGSEGDSDGSGSSSEEEDGEGEGEEYDDEGRDLVKEELGSEAEEIPPDEL
ncbi:hypothetical protein VTN77DRAFT_1231 [Rasamsonia byssochlamydoides]|uniref:uncharacterized protein n=1 Tax=Rasamsonia byssochlamydoides TaxID=89139 RepID=UPI003743D7FE